MAWTLDARIPVIVVAEDAALAAALDGGGAAVLVAGSAPARLAGAVAVAGFDAAAHRAGCECGTCGTGRGPAALALDQLFQGRVRGSVPWFTRLVAFLPAEAARAALRDALDTDAVTAARYRLTRGA